jgi:hypothetical protein
MLGHKDLEEQIRISRGGGSTVPVVVIPNGRGTLFDGQGGELMSPRGARDVGIVLVVSKQLIVELTTSSDSQRVLAGFTLRAMSSSPAAHDP